LPRNGSGTMSISNSFSSGSTIASSAVNANFTDVASEITGSLPRNGEAAMTGQLKAASGTVLLPGVCFSSDTDCGFYRIGADNIGFAIGGVKVLDISSTGVAITGQLTTTNGPIPSGTKMLFYADSAPTGWTIFTTSIDDKALRVVSGSGAGGGTGGATGGTTAFTSVFAARTITASNIPDLTITITDAGHVHLMSPIVTGGGGGTAAAGGAVAASQTSANTASATTGITAAFGTTSRGGAQTTIDFAVTYASVIICTKDA
jgi:hypothetical protein